MKKKKLWILLIVVLFVCSLTSVLFNYKNIKRNIEIAKEEQVEKERKEEMLKQDLISPVLILKQDKLIMYQGDELNYKSFIKEATDNLEGDLTDRVKYTKIDTSKTGEFYVDYEVSDYRVSKLVKMDILLNGDIVDALSVIVHEDFAYNKGREIVTKLRKTIPRQMFEVPIQASIGSKVIARENVSAMKKNVLAKCYGGDVSRKRKLLEKQKEGKKKMKMIGSVEVPKEAFLKLLSDEE